MIRTLPALLLALAVAACSAPPVPSDHYYRLLVAGPEQRDTGAALSGVLSVDLLQADGLLRERPLLFSANGASYELQQHNYHYWNDAPPRMLQDQLVSYLRRGQAARLVVTPDTRVRADYEISGKAKRFERLLGDGEPRVVVEIELSLQRVSDDKLLVVDTFTAEEPADGNSVEASVVALNRATARVFDRFLSEVRGAARQIAEQR